MECFTTFKVYVLGGRLGTHNQLQAFQGFSVVWHFMSQLVHLLSGDNSLVLFRLL